jgi:hypothetical protein
MPITILISFSQLDSAIVCLILLIFGIVPLGITGRQGVGSESRELMVGQGRELGWAGLARLEKDRRLS